MIRLNLSNAEANALMLAISQHGNNTPTWFYDMLERALRKQGHSDTTTTINQDPLVDFGPNEKQLAREAFEVAQDAGQ